MSATSSAGLPAGMHKPAARAIMFALNPETAALLRDCFRQFGVDAIPEEDRSGARLQREKFEACVVSLEDPMAAQLMQTARTSPSNHRILIYGLASSTMQALSYSKYGVNAIIDVPVNRSSALKVVRGSHLLVLNELRRYARVPIVTQVRLETEQRNFDAVTVEISAGGLSLRTDRSLLMNSSVGLTFTLPDASGTKASEIKVRGVVAWVNAQDQRVGIRFDPADQRRAAVKQWVDKYLDI
ncbi:MAG: PilZ domain-containing protein [Acidobacteriota bacterium]|nr:PilZ domain-containing protein [Acidobacteriota bacterium]